MIIEFVSVRLALIIAITVRHSHMHANHFIVKHAAGNNCNHYCIKRTSYAEDTQFTTDNEVSAATHSEDGFQQVIVSQTIQWGFVLCGQQNDDSLDGRLADQTETNSPC